MSRAGVAPVPQGVMLPRSNLSLRVLSSHRQMGSCFDSACICLQPEGRNCTGLIGSYHPSQTTAVRPVGTHALSVEQVKDSPLSAAAVDICVQADLANLADAGSADGSAGEDCWRCDCALLAPFLPEVHSITFSVCLYGVCCVAVSAAR